MVWTAALALLAAQVDPFNRFDDLIPKERLGAGPHTLVISEGSAMTQIHYKSGPFCQRARDETRRQVAPPPDRPGVIYGPPRVTAFCVPR